MCVIVHVASAFVFLCQRQSDNIDYLSLVPSWSSLSLCKSIAFSFIHVIKAFRERTSEVLSCLDRSTPSNRPVTYAQPRHRTRTHATAKTYICMMHRI